MRYRYCIAECLEVLVVALVGVLLVACLWPSNVVLYSIFGCIIALAVVATWWEMHKIRRRQRLLPAMILPSEAGLPASGTQAFANSRDYCCYPPKAEQVLEEILPCNQDGWDFAVHIHEGAEQYLGPDQFSSLVERFKSISGVDDCKDEDREVFLVRTKGLDADALRESCRREFMEAAKTNFEPDKT